jgi:hypothetical protein
VKNVPGLVDVPVEEEHLLHRGILHEPTEIPFVLGTGAKRIRDAGWNLYHKSIELVNSCELRELISKYAWNA